MVRMARWERELWSYLSCGDGDVCPIYQNCSQRLSGIKCPCPVHAGSQFGVGGGLYVADKQDICKAVAGDCATCINAVNYATGRDCYEVPSLMQNVSNCGFIECVRPGRIFEMLEMLAAKYLKRGKVNSPPVPSKLIYSIDREREIEVRPVPLNAYHGAIWQRTGAWIVHINKNDSPERRRLTLFHEAFHILAHCWSNPVFKKKCNDKGSFNELLAENFAYHILMPREWVEAEWKNIGDVDLMAQRFDVPREDMLLRLKALKILQVYPDKNADYNLSQVA